MYPILDLCCTWLILLRDRRYHRWMTLHGTAVHVVRHRTRATQLFATASPARAPVLQSRHGRAVSGAFAGFPIENVDAAIVRCCPIREFPSSRCIVAHQRSDQRTFPFCNQLNGFTEAAVRHHRRDRTKSLHLMRRVVRTGVGIEQHSWRVESALLGIRTDEL